jgi:dsDNA-binding SOS-regulon protein
MSVAADTFDAGFAFAEELTALTHRGGPPSLTEAEREALAQHLIASAVNWVMAHNRAKAAAQ